MEKPQVIEHNVSTNEVVIRDMTNEELSHHKHLESLQIAATAEAQAKATARQEILDRLGITADEAAILLGGN